LLSAKLCGNVRNSRLAAFLLIAIATAFLIATIRPGHDWGGDFALYIAHAKNIATGHQYTDTGFVYNTNDPFLSPRSYPPVFPLLLSPVYALFGLDLHAMKVANILVFSVFLLVYYRYTERRIEHGTSRLVLLAAVAFSPFFWDAKDEILPDYAFLLLLFSTILFVDRRFTDEKAARPAYPAALVAGLLVYLSYGTRSVGIFLIPAMFLHDLVRFRTLKKATIVVASVFLVSYLAQNAWLQTDTSYMDSIKAVPKEVQEDSKTDVDGHAASQQDYASRCGNPCVIAKALVTRIPRKLYYYTQEMNSYWENGYSIILGRVIFAGIGLLAAAGFFNLIVRRSSLGDYFILTYVSVLLVVPFQQARYILPMIPLYLLYAVSGIEWLSARFPATNHDSSLPRRAAVAAFVCIVALSYAGKYTTFSNYEIAHGVESRDSREMLEFIRTSTPADSLIVFHKPRPLALLTGRRSVRYHWEPDVEKLWKYLEGIGATHIILPKYVTATSYRKYFLAMLEHYRGSLDTVFENGDFVVYRIRRG